MSSTRSLIARLRAGAYFLNFFGWLYLGPGLVGREEAQLLRLVRSCAHYSFRIFDLPLTLEGAHRLEGLDQAIYIANHQSWLDQPAVIAASPHLLRFLGKRDYFSYPLLGKVLETFDCLPVDADRPGALIDQLLERVERGQSPLLYPEGTRSRDGEFLPFRSGAYVLSARSQVPIVPLYLYGCRAALPRAMPFSSLRRHPIRVVIGEPFVVDPGFLDEPDTTDYRARFIESWERHKLDVGSVR